MKPIRREETPLKGIVLNRVKPEDSAAAIGSGTLQVYATPALAALAEKASMLCISDHIEENETTVGTQLTINHRAPTPIGADIRCEAMLLNIEERRLTFRFQVFDEIGLIADGTHERVLVNSDRFQQKANQRRAPQTDPTT